MKKNLVRDFLILAVVAGGFVCVQASNASAEDLINNLSRGRAVTLSCEALQDCVQRFPEIQKLFPNGMNAQQVTASAFETVKISSNFSTQTISYDFIRKGKTFVSFVATGVTQENFDKDFKKFIGQLKKPSLVPIISSALPEPASSSHPVPIVSLGILSSVPLSLVDSQLEEEIAFLKSLPLSRLNKTKIAKLEALRHKK